MIRVWFKDIAWADSDGNVIPMNYAKELVFNARLNHAYKQPIITEDSFNGKSYPVQITISDAYQIQFGQREMSIGDISKLQACKEIWVQDFETNELIEVDTTSSGGFTIEPGERLQSANMSFIMTFSTKKILTYPALPRLNTNSLLITIDNIDSTFYTDYDFYQFVTDVERADYQQNSGQLYTAKTIQKTGYRIVFYYLESDAISLKTKLESAKPENVFFNTSIQPIEFSKCTLTALTEGLYKCEVELITSVNLNYNIDASLS